MRHCSLLLFLLYNVVLVFPYINMNPPWVYTCSQSWTPLPPPWLEYRGKLWFLRFANPFLYLKWSIFFVPYSIAQVIKLLLPVYSLIVCFLSGCSRNMNRSENSWIRIVKGLPRSQLIECCSNFFFCPELMMIFQLAVILQGVSHIIPNSVVCCDSTPFSSTKNYWNAGEYWNELLSISLFQMLNSP